MNEKWKRPISAAVAAAITLSLMPFSGTAKAAEIIGTAEVTEDAAELETPAELDGPETPAEPDGPETPAEPDGPETPAEPDGPETPVDTDGSETPAEPDGPKVPAETDEPEVPEKTDEPAAPETPAEELGEPMAAELPAPTAHYNMSHSGNQLLDVANGHDATLYNTEDTDFFQYEGKDVLRFAGEQYATLPQGLISETDNDFAVEITMSVEGPNSSQWAWVIGDGIGTWNEDNVGDYLFVSPKSNQGNFGGKVLTAVKVGSAQLLLCK